MLNKPHWAAQVTVYICFFFAIFFFFDLCNGSTNETQQMFPIRILPENKGYMPLEWLQGF